jgi:hypothetical protein
VGAIVVIVSVVLPLVVREIGFSEQPPPVIAAGTAQVKVTVPVNPPVGVSVIVEV